MQANREFLFTYRFDGKEWGTSVFASSPDEAKEKVKAIALARYDGELMARIPAFIPGSGLLTRIVCWWKMRRTGVPQYDRDKMIAGIRGQPMRTDDGDPSQRRMESIPGPPR